MYWKKESNDLSEHKVIVKTSVVEKDYLCPNCGLPLLKRPFDTAMKMNPQYELIGYDYHCAICNQSFDRLKIEVN
jgi:DNA-directed RNA polymerase subunit RPC12/RpoP